MSCFCVTQEEFYCEVLLLDETKLILTTQHQGIKEEFYCEVLLLDETKLILTTQHQGIK
ncbi:band 4.1-like protein 4, partial [Tachysurus ichikawai]